MSTDYGFSCPTGGDWYACGESASKFVGCCTSDPCSKGCAQGDIRAGGFNVTMHGQFPDASCGAGSDFFTCGFAQTFWGCCKSNPCAANPPATCQQGDLVPAFMGRPEQFEAYVPKSGSSKDSNKGAIIGGAVGGGLGAVIIIGILLLFIYRRRKRQQQQTNPETGAMMKDRPEDRLSAPYGRTPPPTYSSPNPNFFQSDLPSKGHPYHQSYQEYGHNADVPQELPAESSSHTENRYSELPAEASLSQAHRYSELPADASQATAELASPQTSPRPLQGEFATDFAKQANR